MTDQKHMIRVLIVEDQILMRQGLTTILELEDGFEFVGTACDGQEAIASALALHPKEIATCLVLAEGTIKNHISMILDKLQAANRT